MFIKQLSIFVENKPGRLAEITSVREKNNSDIRALSIADTKDFGILRLIVNNPNVAESALKQAGYTVSLTQVIAIGISDKPGGLAKAMSVLYSNHISVEYMYAFLSKSDDTAFVILRVENNEKAIEVLQNSGLQILESSSIYSM